MGLKIFELCRLCLMCFNNIRNEKKDAILPKKLPILILYLTEVKKQINSIFESCQGI